MLLKGTTTANTSCSTLHGHLGGPNSSMSCLDMAPSETVHGFSVVTAVYVLNNIGSDATTSSGSSQTADRSPCGPKYSAY